MLTRHLIATAIALALAGPAVAQTQPGPPPVTAAQQKHQEITARQSHQRLVEAEKNLDKAIGQLKETPVEAPQAAPAQPTVTPQSAAFLQAEQALKDVRRAVDEIEIPQQRRQGVLDRLDDADSAMRMARQPEEADARRKKLEEALRRVQSEVRTAQEETPAK